MKGRKPAARENEIKLALPNAAAGRRFLRAAGFHLSHTRVFESNIVFDTADRRIITSGGLLRLRIVKGKGTLTYKSAAGADHGHKSREEIETTLDSPAALHLILERLGYQPVFRYEKFRSEFVRPREAGAAMLDETPIGVYLELEGPPAWVDRTARRLGFSAKDYITASYARLFFETREARGIVSHDMVFAK